MRVDAKPFSDVRVRQAMRLICDRQQMIDQALSGYGSPRQRPLRPVRPGLRQGPAPARAGHRPGQVAAQVGRPGGAAGPAVHRRRHRLGGPGHRQRCSSEQAKKAGVDVKVVKKNPFYGDDYLSYPFAQDFWNTRNYLPQAAVGALKGGTYNETHFDNPKFAGLIAAAQREIDEAKRTALLQDAQEIEYNEGGYIIWGFRTQRRRRLQQGLGHQAEQVPAAGRLQLQVRLGLGLSHGRRRDPVPDALRGGCAAEGTPRRRSMGVVAGPPARAGRAHAVAGLGPGLRRHHGARRPGPGHPRAGTTTQTRPGSRS